MNKLTRQRALLWYDQYEEHPYDFTDHLQVWLKYFCFGSWSSGLYSCNSGTLQLMVEAKSLSMFKLALQ